MYYVYVKDLMPAWRRGRVVIARGEENEGSRNCEAGGQQEVATPILNAKREWLQRLNGGYSEGAPPLTIPNREVKPLSADGTATVGE